MNTKPTTKQTPYEKADARVSNNRKLEAHRDTIMADWNEGDEHWNWVATAPVSEIVDWAERVEDGR